MSDLMLLGVLRMPVTTSSEPLTLSQFIGRAREAADRIEADADKIQQLQARVLELEAQCEAGAASEEKWLGWLKRVGLLHYYPDCRRPDGKDGQAWVLRRPFAINHDAIEAWSGESPEAALKAFLKQQD